MISKGPGMSKLCRSLDPPKRMLSVAGLSNRKQLEDSLLNCLGVPKSSAKNVAVRVLAIPRRSRTERTVVFVLCFRWGWLFFVWLFCCETGHTYNHTRGELPNVWHFCSDFAIYRLIPILVMHSATEKIKTKKAKLIVMVGVMFVESF